MRAGGADRLPKLPFLLLGGGAGWAAWRLRGREKLAAAAGAVESRPAPQRENLESLLRWEPLAIEVGLGLLQVVEGAQNRLCCGASRLSAGNWLEISATCCRRCGSQTISRCAGASTPSRSRGSRWRASSWRRGACWRSRPGAPTARAAGYTVVDTVSVLGIHLSELIRRHAHELFSRQDAKKLLDRVAIEHPKVVEDRSPKQLGLAPVQKVLQNLLRERVSIRDAVSILEALGEGAGATRNPVPLTE